MSICSTMLVTLRPLPPPLPPSPPSDLLTRPVTLPRPAFARPRSGLPWTRSGGPALSALAVGPLFSAYSVSFSAARCAIAPRNDPSSSFSRSVGSSSRKLCSSPPRAACAVCSFCSFTPCHPPSGMPRLADELVRFPGLASRLHRCAPWLRCARKDGPREYETRSVRLFAIADSRERAPIHRETLHDAAPGRGRCPRPLRRSPQECHCRLRQGLASRRCDHAAHRSRS
jgi:hypothetical protein